MSLKGHTPSPFGNAFWSPKIGSSLRYNTSQAGSPLTIVYGTQRASPNVLEFFGYKSAKSGGKGGKGLGGTSDKKGSNQTYTVNVALGLCQGPVSSTGSIYGQLTGGILYNRIWSNGGVSNFSNASLGINFYAGNDGQAADPVFLSSDTNQPVIGYSGVCYVSGTPLQLGSSPVLPSVSAEITGFQAGTAGPSYPNDARPDKILVDYLTNSRYGAGFPSVNLDLNGTIADWGNYCQAANLAMSIVYDRQQPALDSMDELVAKTVSAMVMSGSLLKVIPYADFNISSNGAFWSPILTWRYSFTDSDYMEQGSGDGGTDPVIITRSDPSTMTNWLSIEYLDANNAYNANVIPVFDQGLIDVYGLRSEASFQAHEFTNPTPAFNCAQLMLQRKAYVRDTFKFKVGFRFALLEPMDIVLLTDSNTGLVFAPVRITSIEEDENGELSIEAEEIPGITP